MAPRHHGVYREEWDTCDRCGFMWPLSKLQMQLGRKVCPYDVDDLSNYYRPKIIAQILQSPERTTDKPMVFRSPQELQF